MKKYKVNGCTDETTTCELCGKKNLKRVVSLENIDTNEEIHVGCDCAGKLLYGSKKTSHTKGAMRIAKVVSCVKKWRKNGFSWKEVCIGVGTLGFCLVFMDFNNKWAKEDNASTVELRSIVTKLDEPPFASFKY